MSINYLVTVVLKWNQREHELTKGKWTCQIETKHFNVENNNNNNGGEPTSIVLHLLVVWIVRAERDREIACVVVPEANNESDFPNQMLTQSKFRQLFYNIHCDCLIFSLKRYISPNLQAKKMHLNAFQTVHFDLEQIEWGTGKKIPTTVNNHSKYLCKFFFFFHCISISHLFFFLSRFWVLT